MSESVVYARRLVRGSTIIFVTLFITGILGLLLRAFLARTFILQDAFNAVTPGTFYGLFELAFAMVSIFELFRGLGLDTALVRHIPEFIVKKEYHHIKSATYFVILIQLVASLVIAGFFFVFSDYLAAAYLAKGIPMTIVVPLIRILAIWFVLMSFFTFTKIFQGFQDMTMYSVVRFFDNMLVMVLALFFVGSLGMGVIGAAYSYMITAIATVMLSFAILRRKYPQVFNASSHIRGPMAKKMSKFALPVFLSGLIGLVIGYMGTLTIAAFRSLAEVGYYQVALPMSAFLTSVVGSVMFVFFPMVAEMWAKHQSKLLGEMLHFLTKFSFIFVMPIVLILVAFPNLVIHLLFGQEYLPAATALQIFAVSTIPWIIYRILGLSLIGIGKPGYEARATIVMATLIVVFNLLLIPIYGVEGAAIASLIALSSGAIALFYYAKKFVSFSVPIYPLVKTIIGGALMLIFIFGLKNLLVLSTLFEAIIVGVFSLLIYVIWILSSGALTKKDLSLFPQMLPLPRWLFKLLSMFAKD